MIGVAVICAAMGIGLSVEGIYQDRFVWIFGYGLRNDEDVRHIERILKTASEHGYNGAVLSAGLDRLSLQDEDYLRRLEEVKGICERYGIELIPSVFSVGYGGSVLAHDRNLAEGFPVKGALFIVENGEARHVPDPTVRIVNGGFEEFEGNRFKGYRFHDRPGVVSFVDTEVKHSGRASIRFENFSADPHGHGRVMQEITVKPRRCYRLSIWVKTEGLKPEGCFRMLVLADGRNLAPREFDLPSTTDWRKVTMIFNSLYFDRVRVYAGVWGAREGRLWLDDWEIEEVGPINVLRRPGTPVTVKSEDGSVVYEEGRDYAPLIDPHFSFRDVDRPAPTLKILPGSRIKEGQRLLVSWYHPMVIGRGQITVCMAEPKLYEIWEREAELLWKYLRYRKVLLSMDEIRMGGSCAACRGRDMAKLLGECITKQVRILRKFNPEAEIYIWSDMLDPNHNAHADYYLVEGDFTGSWNYVPKDLIIAVWGGRPREESLRFFADKGFRILIACYYDADTLDDVRGWLELAREIPGVRGFMYTTWRRRYELLEEFGDMIWGRR
ncbi:hypothetical protein DRP77_01360 [Candidatus Poribacteria bacterium]|nr:MAG: hypothetical protein DRP77_01360 [Candidatus Poribacteria bacterium]